MRLLYTGVVIGVAAATAACSPTDLPCETEAASIADSYDGPVNAFYDGEAYFSLGSECGVRVSGSYAIHESIAEAWTASPFDGHIRPIQVKLRGSVRQSRDGSELLIFEAETLDEASPMESTRTLNKIMRDSLERQAPTFQNL